MELPVVVLEVEEVDGLVLGLVVVLEKEEE